jgi:hypothetical protein
MCAPRKSLQHQQSAGLTENQARRKLTILAIGEPNGGGLQRCIASWRDSHQWYLGFPKQTQHMAALLIPSPQPRSQIKTQSGE